MSACSVGVMFVRSWNKEHRAPHLSYSAAIPAVSTFNQQAIAGTYIAILAKACWQSACLLQKIVSLILYSGHTSKQVGFLN